MTRPSYSKLKARIAELEEENQVLSDKLDSIMDIVSDDHDNDVQYED